MPTSARDLAPGDPPLFAERVASCRVTAEDERRLWGSIDSGRQALEALEAWLGLRPRLNGGGDVGRLGGRFQRLEERLRGRDLPEGADRALVQRAREGRQALHQLVLAHRRLVDMIAERYAAETDLDLSDLVQEGCIGLMRAAERYDPSRGGRFSTYARVWVRQAITRAMADTGDTVRLPVHAYEKLRTVRLARDWVFEELGRDPSAEEVAAWLGWDVAAVAAVYELAKFEMGSLDLPGGDGDAPLGDLIPDPLAADPAEVVLDKVVAEMVAGGLGGLSERDQEVVRLRHGLDGAEPQTLDQIGQRFGITRERVRQIEVRARVRLRRFSQDRGLVEPAPPPQPAPLPPSAPLEGPAGPTPADAPEPGVDAPAEPPPAAAAWTKDGPRGEARNAPDPVGRGGRDGGREARRWWRWRRRARRAA